MGRACVSSDNGDKINRAACRYSAPSSRRACAGSIGPIGLPDAVAEPNSTFGDQAAGHCEIQ